MSKVFPFYLREWRKHQKLTQEKLGELCNLSAPHISNLENRKADITGETLARLAEGLKCQPYDLLMRKPQEAQNILEEWDKIPADRKALALAVIQQFYKNI